MIRLLKILAFVLVAAIVALVIWWVLSFFPMPVNIRNLLGVLLLVVLLIWVLSAIMRGKDPWDMS